jgi:hypothetical protein
MEFTPGYERGTLERTISGVRETQVPQAVLDESSAAAELTEILPGLGHRTVHHVRVPPGFELLMARVSDEPGARRFSSERPALVIRESAAAPSSERGRSDLTA